MLTKIGISTYFFLAIFVMPAFADGESIAERCLTALENSDKASAEELANMIVQFRNISSIVEQQNSVLCINNTLGLGVSYDGNSGRFVTAPELSEIRERNEEAVQRRLANEQQAFLRQIERQIQVDALAAARSEAIRQTVEACGELLNSDRIGALTNPVCSPIFLELGLPEE